MNTVRTMPGQQPGDADASDRWARWLGEVRHGGDPAAREATLSLLAPIRDRVLAGAGLNGSETLLDLGCGDGLIGFAALEQLPRDRVIFSDISAELGRTLPGNRCRARRRRAL